MASLKALLFAVLPVTLVTAAVPETLGDQDGLPAAALQDDAECPPDGGEACTLNALQRRAVKGAAAEVASPNSIMSSSMLDDGSNIPAGMHLVGEGYCCWDDISCKQHLYKLSPGGSFLTADDAESQCPPSEDCESGSVLDLCMTMEECTSVTLFTSAVLVKPSLTLKAGISRRPDIMEAFDCFLHVSSKEACENTCNPNPGLAACMDHIGPATFDCGGWFGECGEVGPTNITKIRADGTKDRWCFAKI